MLEFLKDNYQLIISCFLAAVSLVVFIIRKKPVQVIDGVFNDLFKWCLAAVSYVETKGIVGSNEKLKAALEYVRRAFMDKYYPNEMTSDFYFAGQYEEHAIRYIEAILSCPQKHSHATKYDER